MSISLQADSTLPQGYLKVNGTTAATVTTTGIVGNVTGNLAGNVTGNVTGNADTATSATTATKLATTSGSAPAYACRAWVNFDGTRDASGAASTANTNRLIRASGNVTSVLRNSAGDYTITFSTAMSDANYSVSGLAQYDTSGTTVYPALAQISRASTAFSANSIRVVSANSSTGAAVDLTSISVQIFA